jgi:hypothetical protein
MCQLVLSNLINPGFSRQILIKDFNDKFNENPFRAIGFDTTGQSDTDRRTDTTKPKSATRALAKAPKKTQIKSAHNDTGFIIH